MTLGPHILAACGELPRARGYRWPADGHGVSRDVYHRGRLFLRAGREGATYCCGLTLEVYLRALARVGVEFPLTWPDAVDLQRRWYVTRPEFRDGCAGALVRYGLGVDTTSDPQPGDLAQFWRRNGLGHSVVVLGYDDGALRYLSTQPSTHGVGERVERPVELHVARPVIPETT